MFCYRTPSRLVILAIVISLGLLSASHALRAAAVGSDNASQAAYSGGWSNGSNGAASGSAFLPWQLTAVSGTGSAGFFIGDSTTLGSPGANIDTGGNSSWGLYGNGDPTAGATALRYFSNGSGTQANLSVGQTFTISIAVNYTDGNKGFNLLDSGGGTIFDLNVGSGTYAVNNATTGNGSLTTTYDQNTSFTMSFTQTTITSGTWTVTRNGGKTETVSGTYTGDAGGIKLYDSSGNGGPQNDLYANSIAISSIPEPGTVAAVLVGAGFLLVLKPRRRRGA